MWIVVDMATKSDVVFYTSSLAYARLLLQVYLEGSHDFVIVEKDEYYVVPVDDLAVINIMLLFHYALKIGEGHPHYPLIKYAIKGLVL